MNVAAIVTSGIAVARALYPEAFVDVRVKLGPSSVVDPVLETTVTTWEVETLANVLGYDDSDERKTLPIDAKQRTFLLNAADYPAGARFTQEGLVEVLDDAAEVVETWEIYRAEVPPGAAVVIFYGRR